MAKTVIIGSGFSGHYAALILQEAIYKNSPWPAHSTR